MEAAKNLGSENQEYYVKLDPESLGLGSPSKAYPPNYNAYGEFPQAKPDRVKAPKDMEVSDQEVIYSQDEPHVRQLSGLKHLHNYRKTYMSTLVSQHGLVIGVVSQLTNYDPKSEFDAFLVERVKNCLSQLHL